MINPKFPAATVGERKLHSLPEDLARVWPGEGGEGLGLAPDLCVLRAQPLCWELRTVVCTQVGGYSPGDP